MAHPKDTTSDRKGAVRHCKMVIVQFIITFEQLNGKAH